MSGFKEIHDLLIEMKPETAKHDEDTCGICTVPEQTGEDMPEKTFTEAEAQALVAHAVAEAVTPLQAEIDAVKNSQATAEVEARIAEAVAEEEAKLEAKQQELDAAVLAGETAKNELENLTKALEDAASAAERDAEIARLRDERVAKVAEVASFPDEYVSKNAERWAAMEAEAFDALLDDYEAAGAKPAPKKDDTIPTSTALFASRETTEGSVSPVIELMQLRELDIDPRRV